MEVGVDRFTSLAELVEQMRRCMTELDQRGYYIPAAHLSLAVDLVDQPLPQRGPSVFKWVRVARETGRA
jgi:hypothetical protein